MFSLVTGSVLGGTIHVPADAPTIQIAILNAQPFDMVIVAPGTYYEAINFGGKLITVQSQNPNDPAVVAGTVINALGLGTVVTFAAPGDELNTVLAGFTITGGTIGIEGNGARATIRDCIIRNNSSTGINNLDGQIIRCLVRDNTGVGLNGCDGLVDKCRVEANATGLANYHGTVRDSYVQRNRQNGVAGGNGHLLRCTVSRNDGQGLILCGARIQQCFVTGNSASGLVQCTGVVENSVIAGNQGDGLYGGSSTILNCTITGNRGYGLNFMNGTIKQSIIWDNNAGPLSQSMTPIQSGTVNPYFVQPGYRDAVSNVWVDGDYHVVVGSPYIDAGSPLYGTDPNDPTQDLDGNPRVVGARVDIGAYEFQADCDGPDFDADDIADVCDSDMDDDGVPNIADVCDETLPGVGVDDNGRPYADMNRDCKVDLYDFAVFQNQLSGP